MKKVSRRELLGAAGLAAGTSLVSGCGNGIESQTLAEEKRPAWQYVPLVPATVAAEAYRLMPEGGCMYGLFAAVLAVWSKESGQSCESFPLHMMRYGEGGIGGWGTVCGALNAGAAVIGLFEKDKQRRGQIIGELFSWYESTDLPIYRPSAAEAANVAKSTAKSVLCHVSAGRWCKTAGYEVFSKEMGERCHRLTADVATKVVELLNCHLDNSGPFADLRPEIKSCVDCHGRTERRDSIGKMGCNPCHTFSKKHP